jgi:hypothetical protein
VISILLIPLVAMQFTNEVNWTLTDFIVAGILLLGCVTAIEFVFRKLKPSKYKIVFTVIIVLIFLMVWAELAVGIFGTPFAGQ